MKLGKKILDIVPVTAADEINSLVRGPDGLVYGCAGSWLVNGVKARKDHL